MGKTVHIYTDSEPEERTVSTSESVVVKRKRFSFLNYAKKLKKNKRKVYSSSESEDFEFRNGNPKLRGILKRNNEIESSDDEIVYQMPTGLPKCLIGRVPGPSGETSSKGSGFAMIIRRNCNINPSERLTKKNHKL